MLKKFTKKDDIAWVLDRIILNLEKSFLCHKLFFVDHFMFLSEMKVATIYRLHSISTQLSSVKNLILQWSEANPFHCCVGLIFYENLKPCCKLTILLFPSSQGQSLIFRKALKSSPVQTNIFYLRIKVLISPHTYVQLYTSHLIWQNWFYPRPGI